MESVSDLLGRRPMSLVENLKIIAKAISLDTPQKKKSLLQCEIIDHIKKNPETEPIFRETVAKMEKPTADSEMDTPLLPTQPASPSSQSTQSSQPQITTREDHTKSQPQPGDDSLDAQQKSPENTLPKDVDCGESMDIDTGNEQSRKRKLSCDEAKRTRLDHTDDIRSLIDAINSDRESREKYEAKRDEQFDTMREQYVHEARRREKAENTMNELDLALRHLVQIIKDEITKGMEKLDVDFQDFLVRLLSCISVRNTQNLQTGDMEQDHSNPPQMTPAQAPKEPFIVIDDDVDESNNSKTNHNSNNSSENGSNSNTDSCSGNRSNISPNNSSSHSNHNSSGRHNNNSSRSHRSSNSDNDKSAKTSNPKRQSIPKRQRVLLVSDSNGDKLNLHQLKPDAIVTRLTGETRYTVRQATDYVKNAKEKGIQIVTNPEEVNDIVFNVSLNDFRHGRRADQIQDEYLEMLQLYREAFPNARFHLTGIPPMANGHVEVNIMLQRLAYFTKCNFISTKVFQDKSSGKIRSNLMQERNKVVNYHYNDYGIRVLAKEMKKSLYSTSNREAQDLATVVKFQPRTSTATTQKPSKSPISRSYTAPPTSTSTPALASPSSQPRPQKAPSSPSAAQLPPSLPSSQSLPSSTPKSTTTPTSLEPATVPAPSSPEPASAPAPLSPALINPTTGPPPPELY